LTENPGSALAGPAGEDVLSNVLRTVRLSGSLQFCLMPSGTWRTEGKVGLASLAANPSTAIPFHVLVEGSCWLTMEGRELPLAAGDVVAFPFATSHQLGVGTGGRPVSPVEDLPPRPWRTVPILRYGDGPASARLLCGYLQCDALNFRPLREALPTLLHARASPSERSWLRATLDQIVAEVDSPRSGGLSMLERLTEITFIELLRQQIGSSKPNATGWLAALGDFALGRCLAAIHDDPRRSWSLQTLAAASALSRSALNDRFEAVLDSSPMRYVREWRLHLASVDLGTTTKSIATIADEAGYGTESAFNRAFSRTYGVPPATWRRNARRGPAQTKAAS
jgi:AraC-like DNA-binding protein